MCGEGGTACRRLPNLRPVNAGTNPFSAPASARPPGRRPGWLNRTVLGIGLASLLSDWAHETATAVLPAFLAGLGVAAAWLGRGVRTPVRKALLAGAVTPETYGRAFGFERMMDTCGAIVGPATAVGLLAALDHHYPTLFAWTLVPGLLAAALMAWVVVEKQRRPVPRVAFGQSLRALPRPVRRFLLAVGVFGAGDFAHSMLLLLATQQLTPTLGAARAANVAVGLYLLHNVLYAGFAFLAGWLADWWDKRRLLAGGYGLAAVMAAGILLLPLKVWTLGLVFALGGIYVAVEETVEDSLCAELVEEAQHGMALGTLATVNGLGDLLSSVVVGALWSWAGTTAAFAYAGVLFVARAVLVLGVRPSAR